MRCIIKLNPINTITQNLKQRKFLKGQSIRKETDLANGLSGTKGAFDHSHDFSVCTVNKKSIFSKVGSLKIAILIHIFCVWLQAIWDWDENLVD